jgi:DNA polymerase-3 subunit epsilon
LRVSREDGRVLGVVGSAFEWQEPAHYTELAQRVTRVPAQHLAGRRFDRPRIEALIAQSDLVVAHHTAFEWAFLAPLFPALADLPWACSLRDIDWTGSEGIARPSIDGLLAAYALGPTDHTPESDCHALARILAQRLPGSGVSGFRRLLEASACVTVCCALPSPSEAIRDALRRLGFESTQGCWCATCVDTQAALALEMRVIDLAVDNPEYAGFRMWRIDTTTRHASAGYFAS